MKKHLSKSLTLIALTIWASVSFAQVPPPPPSGHGSGGNVPAGGGATLGGGIGIIIALGAAYGGRKLYQFYKGSNSLED
mgnify:CR=1 FL=1